MFPKNLKKIPKIIIKAILQKMEFIQKVKIPLAMAILLFASVGVVCANLDGWQYQKYITVKENSGNTLTDYQILVNLSDGRDIRFTDESGNLLPYWTESYSA